MIVFIDWHHIEPKDATNILLVDQGHSTMTYRPDIVAPFNEMGERCPWPWEPQQLVNAAFGQYHCPYCGAMVMANWPHLDYGPNGDAER